MNKDKIFEILSDWNYWFKPLPKTHIRKIYEKEIAKKSEIQNLGSGDENKLFTQIFS